VWPLHNCQRKLIYKSLIINGLKKEKLIDYQENSYVFRRINQDKEETKEPSSPYSKTPLKKGFGETYLDLDQPEHTNLILNKTHSERNMKQEQLLNNSTEEKINKHQSNSTYKTKQRSQSRSDSDEEEKNIWAKTLKKSITDDQTTKSLNSSKDSSTSFKRTNSIKYLPIRPKLEKQVPSEKDNIISLDVKRTHVERAEFDHVALEQILRNIAHPRMGNFAYYQGLNYIVAFFLDLVREPLDTYNITITLLESHFRKYVNSDMENLKVLFYVLRRLIKVYLPELSQHFESTESLETNVIFANWILTVFTTLKQYGSHVALLDQVTDIFISKGWTGFFRCILVILSYIEKDLLSLQAEHLIMFMTDFPKRSFVLLGQTFNDKETQQIMFNFKEECGKFENIDSLLVHEMSMEYHHLQESFEKQWLSLFKKVERLYK
jgi:hypothetical protein